MERNSSINKGSPSTKSSVKQLFAYEQPVLEETHDCIDLESPPTTPSKDVNYPKEILSHNGNTVANNIDQANTESSNSVKVLDQSTTDARNSDISVKDERAESSS